jgi:hypothetical protein
MGAEALNVINAGSRYAWNNEKGGDTTGDLDVTPVVELIVVVSTLVFASPNPFAAV